MNRPTPSNPRKLLDALAGVKERLPIKGVDKYAPAEVVYMSPKVEAEVLKAKLRKAALKIERAQKK